MNSVTPSESTPLLGSVASSETSESQDSRVKPIYTQAFSLSTRSLKKTVDLTRKFSPILLEGSLGLVDIPFIIAKAFKADKISIALYTALSLIGLGFTIYFLDQFTKYGKDLSLARRVDSKIIQATSALRLTSKFNDVALTAGSCTAAIAQQCGNPKLMRDIFKVTIPYGEAALVLAALTNIITLIVDRQTLKKIQKRDLSDEDWLNIFNTLSKGKLEAIVKKPSKTELKELERLAARIQSSLDKDTRRKLNSLINDEEAIDIEALHGLKKAIETNIKIQVKVTQGGRLVVMAGDYLLLAVSDAFPNSITGASCEVTGYFLNLGYWILDKLLEAKNRGKMKASPSKPAHSFPLAEN